MKIVVCVKHVPDVQSERRFDDSRLVRGEDDVLNELDENAVEAAVSLVEDLGGEVIVLTMGDEDAEDGVRRALQMGADSGVIVADAALEGTDVPGTATVLARAISRIGGCTICEDGTDCGNPLGDVDLIITGMASLDAMTSMLPAALATVLKVPALTLANSLTVSSQDVNITRTLGAVSQSLTAPLPAVVSVTDQANEPRYPNFAAMRAAKKKPIDVWSLQDLGLAEEQVVARTEVTAASQRPERQAGTIITDAGEAGTRLAQWLRDEGLV
ncbi:electron transfer flavoprotein subunit beta/FixA family protein [Actinomyces vulturis]|uniref:electron transfer flavoprotein subunit beta/FixA family protein n=1 Tax=Actinomyces vulturis TaxID=1857645 RepID=UPI00083777F0|nr:electron transfer flavoprotein subunit beta/FixA family protein [Actinomyces vulturis]